MTNKFLGVFEWYEAIGKWLVENAPEPWEKIVIDFEIEEIDDVFRILHRLLSSRLIKD